MKNRSCWLMVLLLWIIPICSIHAQISEGGTPASFAFQENTMVRAAKKIPYTAQVNFDVKQLRAEDQATEENNTPPRVGIIIPVDLNINNAGEWTTLPDGQRIWKLTVKAPEAIATMLYYDRFYIPDGGKLFIYNADHTHLLGAYTSRTNPDDKEFATEFVAGDEIILEYNEPVSRESEVAQLTQDMPDIQITGIGYGYNYIEIKQADSQLKALSDLSCMVHINCPEGDKWQYQKRGVAKSLTPIGKETFWCSGTLVNNTAEDATPFFLTASHCFYDNSNVKCSQWDQIIYYFHNEKTGCSPYADKSPDEFTVTGAQLLVEVPTTGGSDGALLKLNRSIPADYNVYYNGWNRSNTASTSNVGIHHPAGGLKAISTSSLPAMNITYSSVYGATNAHWLVLWHVGTTAGGSSGSPLFNQNGLITGTLTGGSSKCPDGGTDYYGKLWYHWDGFNAVGDKKMKDYLDPLNTGATTLEGTYPGIKSDATLSDLSVSLGTLTPKFNPGITDYTVNVNFGVKSITVTAKAANVKATVTGAGTHTVTVGNNIIPVTITSQDGKATKTYTVTVIRSTTPDEYDVHVVGNEYTTAKYWRNGVAVTLDAREANTIAVQGNDVHIAGFKSGDGGRAWYWKNGVETILPTEKYSSANSIFLHGDDVYVAGYSMANVTPKRIATYWKNGKSILLTDGTFEASANSIYVQGDDVYVAGYEKNAAGKQIAKYWKNGTSVALTDGGYWGVDNAWYITVSGSDVYVAGEEALIRKYWKNGKPVTIYDRSEPRNFNIVVSGNDVYIPGRQIGRDGRWAAVYWKNGIAVPLTDGTTDAEARWMTIVGDDIYVIGSELNSAAGKYYPKYWKNGVKMTLESDGNIGSANINPRQIVVAPAQGASDNANLSALSVNPGTLTPAFNANTTSYTANVANSVSSITVSATLADGNAKVAGTGVRTLNVGSNTIPVTVTAENGTTTKTYTIVVTRQSNTASNNAALGAIAVNSLPAGLKAGSATTYEITVGLTAEVTIAATPAHTAATVSGDLGVKTVQTGLNTFHIKVTAEDGITTVNYLLEVTVKEVVSGVDDLESNPLKVYPNPARDHITISGLQGNGILTLFDSSGKQLRRRNISTVEEKLYVGDLLPGKYIIRVEENKEVRIAKVVIE